MLNLPFPEFRPEMSLNGIPMVYPPGIDDAEYPNSSPVTTSVAVRMFERAAPDSPIVLCST